MEILRNHLAGDWVQRFWARKSKKVESIKCSSGRLYRHTGLFTRELASTKRRSELSTEVEGTKKKFKSGNVFSWHRLGCTGRVEQYCFDLVAT